MPSLIASLSALALVVAWLPATALSAAETADLSGHWLMDKELSEDPMAKMRERDSGMRRGGSMGGGGARGGGMGGGRGGAMSRSGGQGPGPSREEMRQRMQELRASLERLQITQTDSWVRFVYADEREQALLTDNKKTAIDTPFGEGTIRARWRDDGGLVVKTKTERRKTTETYYVTADRSLLTVLVELENQGPGATISFKRLYRPAAAEAETDLATDEAPAAG